MIEGTLDYSFMILLVGVLIVLTMQIKAGLESNLQGLLKQLRSASLIWLADITISGALAVEPWGF